VHRCLPLGGISNTNATTTITITKTTATATTTTHIGEFSAA